MIIFLYKFCSRKYIMALPAGKASKIMKKHDINLTPFIMFQAHPDDYHSLMDNQNDYHDGHNSHDSHDTPDILSEIFFDPKNIELIQKQLIMEVFRKSNGEYWIEKQSEIDLLVLMRKIFSAHARHLPHKIKEQVRELDDLVVTDAVPGIMSQIYAQFGYLADVYGPRHIMEHPKNVSRAGLKILPSIL